MSLSYCCCCFRSSNLSSVGVMCILRIVYTKRGNVDSSGQWVYAQLNVGIVCACLPTLRPVVPKSATVTTTIRNLISSLRSSLRTSASNRGPATDGQSNDASISNRNNRYRNISHDAIDKAHLTEAVGGSEPFDPKKSYPLGRITVQKDIEVV